MTGDSRSCLAHASTLNNTQYAWRNDCLDPTGNTGPFQTKSGVVISKPVLATRTTTMPSNHISKFCSLIGSHG